MEMAASGKLYINTKLDTGSVPFELADLRSVHGEVTKFLVTAPGQLSIPLPPLPEGCRVYLTDGGLAANITLPTASKDTAMSALLDRLGFGYDAVMAFGDDVNDLELLRRSRVGVAMANVVAEVRSCADRVTLSNAEDGVAVVLEELVNNAVDPSNEPE